MPVSDERFDELTEKYDEVGARGMTADERRDMKEWLAEHRDDEPGRDADDDDEEVTFWETGRDGVERGATMPVRVARKYAPPFVQEWLTERQKSADEAAAALVADEVGERRTRRRSGPTPPRRETGEFGRHTGRADNGHRYHAGRRIG